MRSLVLWVLSKLFPPRLNAKLTLSQDDLHATLDFYRRDSRRKPFVWSSIGSVVEHSASPALTERERRNREIPEDYFIVEPDSANIGIG
jgi:hypothetical protein